MRLRTEKGGERKLAGNAEGRLLFTAQEAQDFCVRDGEHAVMRRESSGQKE